MVGLPNLSELPYVSVHALEECLFRSIDIENIIIVIRSLLLEKNVLMISRSVKKLIYVGEAIHALLFPFRCETLFLPYLPGSLIDFLHAPTPFFVGILD